MVPLLAGSPGGAISEDGLASKASVELAWMTEHPELGENGTLSLTPPRVDMPVSALSVELQFPKLYLVNFSGSMRRVQVFSHKQPAAVNYQTERFVVPSDYQFVGDKDWNPEGVETTTKASEPNVKATLPKQGRRYRFEQILVVDGNVALNVTYAANRSSDESGKAWWEGISKVVR